MNGYSLESGQNAETIKSFLTTAGMYTHPGQVGDAAVCSQWSFPATLIPVSSKWATRAFRTASVICATVGGQITGCGVTHPDYGTRRQGDPMGIAHDPGGTQDRQHVALGEIDDGGVYAWAILRGSRDGFRKFAPMYLAPGGTYFRDTMFGDFDLLRRYIEDLTGVRYMGLVRSAAAGIAGCGQRMNDHLIRCCDALQR